MRCAVIGLGEAGARYAAALVAGGHEVVGHDPLQAETPVGVRRAATVREAVTGAAVVLVLTGAAATRSVAAQCREHLAPGTCYADFTSSSPRVMAELSDWIGEVGAAFADVAILGPITVHGASAPLMVSGPGAKALAGAVETLEAPVEILDAPAGAAMGHKLLRSVLMKGLASLVCEAVAAGEAAGHEDWIRDQIARQLAGDGHAVIERFLTGTQVHAERRAHEMADAVDYLRDLGVPAEMAEATERSLRRMTTESQPT